MTPEEILERVGEIADKVSNFAEYANNPDGRGSPMDRLLPALRIDALSTGILGVRDELVALIVDLGGERPWWAE